MQLGTEIKGWSDAEVDEALAHLSVLEDSTIQNGEFIYAVRDSGVMIVFILAVLLGYIISVNIIPSLKAVTGGSRR